MPLIPTNPIDANTYLPGTQVIPSSMEITAITNAYPMEITYISNDGNIYISGMAIKLKIPDPYGMYQANGLVGTILTNTSPTMTVDIDSRSFDAFSIPVSIGQRTNPPTLSPAGSRNLQYSNSTNQVAFQNLNNQGN